MALLPPQVSWHERIEELILGFRGKGVSLSSDDMELLDKWFALDAPVEIIARGLNQAAEQQLWNLGPNDRPLRHLKSARRFVEKEYKKFRARSVRANLPAEPEEAMSRPLHLERHERLKKALENGDYGLRFNHLIVPENLNDCESNELRVYLAFLRSMPLGDRVLIFRQALEHVNAVAVSSRLAKKQSLRFHYGALVRKHFSLPVFW